MINPVSPKETHPMQLTYSGQTFTLVPGTRQRSFKPQAVNWRYQVSNDITLPLDNESPQRPTAVNWRYQLPTE